MTIRHRNRFLLGMGALLGLCVTGCQNGLMTARPTSLREAMAALKPSRPSAEILRPRTFAMRSSPAAIATSSPAVVIEPPIIRASAEAMPGKPVVASTWHAVSSGSAVEPMVVTDLDPNTGGVSLTQPEKLAAPRIIGEPVQGTVVSTHIMHGEPGHMVMYSGHHGMMHSADVPREGSKAALPPYVIEPPDVLEVQLLRDPKRVPQPVSGQFLVRPDGSISLGVYGSAHVGGLTLDAAKAEVVRVLRTRLEDYEVTDDTGKKRPIKIEDEVVVDVLEYASKFCYVIADGGGSGAQVVRIAVNGSDTVLDTIGKIGGLPPQASKKLWLARPATGQMLPIDWNGVSQRGQVATNYQVFPGDRIYVKADPRIRFQSEVQKTIAPFETITGGVLLGASAKNALRGNRSGSNSNNNGN